MKIKAIIGDKIACLKFEMKACSIVTFEIISFFGLLIVYISHSRNNSFIDIVMTIFKLKLIT